MAIKTAIPYLVLAGKADEAISFYERALGAKVERLQRFGEMQHDCPEAVKNQVMHGVLRLGEATLFISDGAGEGQPPAPGSGISVALDFDDPQQARACFDALSKGGTVIQPIFEAPWGALFGAMQDRFGINWMFHAALG